MALVSRDFLGTADLAAGPKPDRTRGGRKKPRHRLSRGNVAEREAVPPISAASLQERSSVDDC